MAKIKTQAQPSAADVDADADVDLDFEFLTRLHQIFYCIDRLVPCRADRMCNCLSVTPRVGPACGRTATGQGGMARQLNKTQNPELN